MEIKSTQANPSGRDKATPPDDSKGIKLRWEKRIDQARLAAKLGITLSGREMLAATRDFEDEVSLDALANISPERLQLVFAAYLRKWVKRFQRKIPAIDGPGSMGTLEYVRHH